MTHDFDAKGTRAATIADDAVRVYGPYPARFVAGSVREQDYIIE